MTNSTILFSDLPVIVSCFAVFSLLFVLLSDVGQAMRDFKIQRHGRQHERQTNKRFNKQNNNFAGASRFFVHFIPVLKEDVNKQRRNFISLSELENRHLKFSFRRVCLHLTKQVGRNNCRKDSLKERKFPF